METAPQRSKVFWLTEGDLNTKFFHQQASNRRKKNLLKGLFNDAGVWCTKDDEMEGIVLDYFGKLFSSSHPTNLSETNGVLPKVVTDEMNLELTKIISAEEVLCALKHPSKVLVYCW